MIKQQKFWDKFLIGLLFIAGIHHNCYGAMDKEQATAPVIEGKLPYPGPTSTFLAMTGTVKRDYLGNVSIETLDRQFLQTKGFIQVADPTYDQTFKALFTGNEDTGGGITGVMRLKSLLNSIYYPDTEDDPNGFKIREITPLDGEVTSPGQTDATGVMRFDIACTCKCWRIIPGGTSAPVMELFDVEMQRAYDSMFENRLYNYASGLHRKHDRPVKVLAFLNHLTGTPHHLIGTPLDDKSTWIMPCTIDQVTGVPLAVVRGLVDIHSIDLKVVAEKLNKNEDIVIHTQHLRKVGREWLKLLSIRQWQWQQPSVIKYNAVLDDSMTPEVRSAMVLLTAYDDTTLLAWENDMAGTRGMLITANITANLTSWMDVFVTTGGKLDPQTILPSCIFPPVREDFARAIWGERDSNGWILFLGLLKEKGLLQ